MNKKKKKKTGWQEALLQNSWTGPKSPDPSDVLIFPPPPNPSAPSIGRQMVGSNPGRVSVRRSGHATGPSQSASPVRLSGVVSRKEKLDWERKAVTRHYRLFPFFFFYIYTVLVFFFFFKTAKQWTCVSFPFLFPSPVCLVTEAPCWRVYRS